MAPDSDKKQVKIPEVLEYAAFSGSWAQGSSWNRYWSLRPQTKCSIQILAFFLFEPSSESSAAFKGMQTRWGVRLSDGVQA